MNRTRPEHQHDDARGRIIDILAKETIDAVTIITSAKGTTRGHHYHLETTQWVYLLEGRMKVLTQMPDSAVVATILERGELILTPPKERHAMVALEESTFLVLTRGPRSGQDYESDTYRLAEPLQEL